MDPNNSVIKRLWCIDSLPSDNYQTELSELYILSIFLDNMGGVGGGRGSIQINMFLLLHVNLRYSLEAPTIRHSNKYPKYPGFSLRVLKGGSQGHHYVEFLGSFNKI